MSNFCMLPSTTIYFSYIFACFLDWLTSSPLFVLLSFEKLSFFFLCRCLHWFPSRTIAKCHSSSWLQGSRLSLWSPFQVTSPPVLPISLLIKEHTVLFSTLPNKAASHMDFHTHQVAFSLGVPTSSNGPSSILCLDLFQVLLARPMSQTNIHA